jgi:hypothetical protein
VVRRSMILQYAPGMLHESRKRDREVFHLQMERCGKIPHLSANDGLAWLANYD